MVTRALSLDEEFKKVTQSVAPTAITWHTSVFAGAFLAIFMIILEGGLIHWIFPATFTGIFFLGVLISVSTSSSQDISRMGWKAGLYLILTGVGGLFLLAAARFVWPLDTILVPFVLSIVILFGSLKMLGKEFVANYANDKPLNYNIVFSGLILFFVGLTVFFVIIGMRLTAFSLGMWILCYIFSVARILGVTIGYHRLATHKAFKAGTFFSMLMFFCGAMAGERPVLRWGPEHKIHHTWTEIEARDPHTTHEGLWWSHFLWIWFPYVYPDTIWRRHSLEFEKDRLIHNQKYYYAPAVLFGTVFPVVLFGLLGLWSAGEFSWWNGLVEGFKGFLLVGSFSLGLTYNITFSVNSVAHFWGPQPYKDARTGDSRDVWLLSIFSFGETLQDIHHLVQDRACYWIKDNYYDISGVIILSLAELNRRYSWLGWAGLPYGLKLINARKQKIKEHTVALQAV